MSKKNVIITGGSSGIGAAIAGHFSVNGYNVFNLDINKSEDGRHFQCDVSDHDAVHACVREIARHNNLDVLVSNAGIHYSGDIEQTSESDFIKLFNINVKSAFSLTQAAVPHMKQKGGSIIYIGSDQSKIGKPNSCAYNMSKHAIASLAKTTALDYAKYNIRANLVCPGTIDTPLYQKAINTYCEKSGSKFEDVHAEESSLQPLNRIGKPEEVAAMVYYLASDDAQFVTGAELSIDGGYTTK